MSGTETRVRPSPVVRAAGTGEALWAMGSLMEVKLGEGERRRPHGAGGDPAAGVATPLHVHQHEAEVFYLLAGTMDTEAGGELHHLEAGAMIWLPQGVPHRFRVTGKTPVRFLGLAVPAGIERLYRAVGVPAAAAKTAGAYPAEPELARWRAAAPDHGLKVLGPPLPER